MNLRETISALAANNVLVGIDLGVHANCDLGSNCPLAVKVRKIIKDSGISMEAIWKEYDVPDERALKSTDINITDINAKTTVNIHGRSIEIDITDTVSDVMKDAILNKIRLINHDIGRIRNLARDMNKNCIREIAEAKRTKILPIFDFPVDELLKYGCTFSSQGGDYIFLFKSTYRPQYIFSRGYRYQLCSRHINKLTREVNFMFRINRDWHYTEVSVLDNHGHKFHHYHGDRYDCWGHVDISSRWDGTLEHLVSQLRILEGSLATINKDSPMNEHPPGLYSIETLGKDAVCLGAEGELGGAKNIPRESGWGHREV